MKYIKTDDASDVSSTMGEKKKKYGNPLVPSLTMDSPSGPQT